MLAFALSVALASAPPEVRYHRNAQVALYGGLAATAVPPVATGLLIALQLHRLPPPPHLPTAMCRQGGLAGLICILLFPVFLILDVVLQMIWLTEVVFGPLLVTAPLYPVLPGLLLRTSMRARRALLDVNEPVPGTWGTLGTVAFGAHLAGAGAAVGLLAAEEDDAAVGAAAVSFAGWAGGVFCGLEQWRVDRKHARAIGLAGPDAATAREIYVPLFAVSGTF